MKKLIIGSLLILNSSLFTLCSGQSDTCTMHMKTANADYEQQNYDDAIKLLIPAIAHCPLNKEDKIQANKLLILCYLAIDNLEAANKVAEAIMKENPNYKPDKFKDDPKLASLFEKYKPTPVFNIGIFGGLNIPSVHIINTYAVADPYNTNNSAGYSSKSGFQLGVRAEYKVYRDFWLEAGFEYRQTSYGHNLDSIEGETVTYSEKLTYIDVPLSVKYYFLKKNWHPYLRGGIDFSFLSTALSTISRGVEQDVMDRTSLRNTFLVGYSGAAGCSYKYNNFLFFLDVSYIYFPKQVNKAGTRNDDNIDLWKYYYTDDDFSMNNMQVNIGAAYIFKYKNLKH